jgi:hypothetical protein
MYYFAYATDLNRRQLAKTCPNAKPLFKAVLPNFKLIFTGWSRKTRGGTASVKPYQGEKVPGAVYELSELDLRRLDKEMNSPAERLRITALVIGDDGDSAKATFYVNKQQSEETEPSRDYLKEIQAGYREWEL